MSLSTVGARLADSLLEQTGSEFAYSRNGQRETITFYKSDLRPILIDSGNGVLMEIIMADFRGVLADFPSTLGNPRRGDVITADGEQFTVEPITDKCFYTVGGMLHIHAKRTQ